MFKFLKKLFNLQKMCTVDKTKECPFDYTFDRNGALCVEGNIMGCCKLKRQIEAAARLGKELERRKNNRV